MRQLASDYLSAPKPILWQGLLVMKQISLVSLLLALSLSSACSKDKKEDDKDDKNTKVDKPAPGETKPAPSADVKPATETAATEATPALKAPEPGTEDTAVPSPDKPSTSTKITHLDAKAAQESLSGEVIVLDIRTPAEFAEGHIEGALNIDFNADNFADNIDKLDKSKEYLVHCRSGGRSGRSLPTFESLGFEKILHLDGGMNGWVEAGLSTKK